MSDAVGHVNLITGGREPEEDVKEHALLVSVAY